MYPNTNSSAWNWGSKSSFCDEQSALNPISEYGKMKCQVESKLVEKKILWFLDWQLFLDQAKMRLDLLVNAVYKAYIDNYLVLLKKT